jgi:amidohydrolase
VIFRHRRTGSLIAESMSPSTASHVNRTLSRGVLAAACACCATGLFAPAATAATPSEVSALSRRDPAETFGLTGAALLNGLGLAALAAMAGPTLPIHQRLDAAAAAIEPKMIAWRRDFHQNPELGNQEVRTAGIVARHLRSLGYDVRENIAVTGIVATMRGGGGPGPVVALRADMDALPVFEEVDLPFASRARAVWDAVDVPVMHACGHDCHTAILMAAAEVLAYVRQDLRGTIKLLFQPAEENLANGEIGGAKRMLAEGAFTDPKPDVVFGLHMISHVPAGSLGYRPGPTCASSDVFRITVNGRQAHGAFPWHGVDAIAIGAQIVSALQTIQSRQVDVNEPSVLTIGTFNAGSRVNILSGQAVLTGTLRTYSDERRTYFRGRVAELAASVAQGMDGTADTHWEPNGYPVTVNDPVLTERMIPSLARVAGEGRLLHWDRLMAAEDFSYFAQQAPGLFFWVGTAPADADLTTLAPNHSPLFRVDEATLILGLRGTLHLVADYTGSVAIA